MARQRTPSEKALDDYAQPSGLDAKGVLAYQIIMRFLKRYDATYSGGAKVFYSPKEWAERGEDYGRGSHLIVTYDGGDHRMAFNMDEEAYAVYDELQAKLAEAGMYFEECTGWYSAVYSS